MQVQDLRYQQAIARGVPIPPAPKRQPFTVCWEFQYNLEYLPLFLFVFGRFPS